MLREIVHISRRRSRRLGVLAFALTAACSAGDETQGGLGESTFCDGACVITLDTVVDLGRTAADISPKGKAIAIQAVTGDFFVAPTDHPGTVAIYSSSGELRRTFGSVGKGPGEYDLGQVQFHRGRGDTISIIDVFLLRRTVIDQNGNATRLHPIPDRFPGYFEIGNRSYFFGMRRGKDGKSHLVHELNGAGDIKTSAVEVVGTGDLSDSYRGRAPTDSGLWIASRTRYKAEFYGPDLARRRTIEPAAKWFQPHQSEFSNPVEERPKPRILHLHQDVEGVLWFIISVADVDWEPIQEAGEVMATAARIAQLYDWILEAVDPLSGARIASTRFDWPIMFGGGDALLYGSSEGTNGQGVLTAMRFHLGGHPDRKDSK